MEVSLEIMNLGKMPARVAHSAGIEIGLEFDENSTPTPAIAAWLAPIIELHQ